MSYREKFFAAVRRDDEPLLRYYVALSITEPDISLLFVIREHVISGQTALQIAASNGYFHFHIISTHRNFRGSLCCRNKKNSYCGAAEILIDQAVILGSKEAIDAVDDHGMYVKIITSRLQEIH